MRKFILRITLISTFCFSTLLADSDTIDERKIDIYFGNGVWNTKKQAEISRKELEKRIIKRDIIKNNPKLAEKYGEVKLQYNWGKGKMEDVLETYYQLKEAGQVNNFEFFVLMELLTNGKHSLSMAATTALMAKMPYTAEVEEQNVNQMLAGYYIESFVYSHRVLLVSHSQGNLFANRVYDSLDPKGYQDNFANVQVGSPADKIEAKMGEYITNKGDLIINPIPYSMKGNANVDPENNVLPECLKALKSFDKDKVINICKNTPDNHQFIPYYLSQKNPYNKIVKAIKNQLKNLDTTPSQWVVDKEFKKDTKDNKITVKHRFDNAFDYSVTGIDNKDIYPFNTKKGKLYQVSDPDGTKSYVKASFGGEKIQDSWSGQDEDNEFYKLEGTSPIEYITGKMKDCKNISMFPGGLFNAQLRWHEDDVNMTLSSSLMSQSESGCGIAAAGSGDKTLYSVYPGTYSVNVLASGYEKLDHNISDLITLNVNAVGNSKKSSTLVTKAYEYAHLGKDGHLADIVITRPDPTKPPVVETIPTIPSAKINHTTYGSYPYSGSGSGSYHRSYSSYGGSSHRTSSTTYSPPPPLCNKSCGCLPCEYDILMYLNQARLGPISGAKVILYKATQEDDMDREILYEGSTSVSSEIDKAGVISLPIPYPEQKILSDEEKSLMDKIAGYDGDFILEVSGGFDIDRDDDYNVDSTFTKLDGKLHLIVDKESLLNNDYKVNILTEVAYQLSRDILGSSYDKQRVEDRLDDIAKRVFIEKLYPSSNEPIGRDDLFYWIPSAHKKWLVKSYSSYLDPIVDKVYRGDDIYDDAYKFVYEELKNSSSQTSPAPILSSKWIKVSEDTSSPAKIGKVAIKSEGESSIVSYTLSGSGSELFEVDSSGDIYLKENKTLDFEKTSEYQLTLVAKNSQATSRPVTLHIIVGNVVDSPEDRSFSGGVFAEDAKSGDVVGRIVFDEGTSPIDRIEIGGEDKESFDIDLDGAITLSSSANFDYEKKNYASITVQAFNHDGSSRVVPIIFTITDAIDVPIVKKLDTHISENAKALDVVGKVEILSNDPITDITLSGYGSEDFKIDNLGEIIVNDGVSLDYERRSNYVLKVVATNIQGDSREGTVVIRVDNELDIPVLENRTYHILEYSPIDTEVGKVGIKTEGLSSISRFTLSGYGSENFTIDDSGMIRVANDMLNHFENQYYNLTVKAENTQGESNSVIVVVYIDTQRPILGSLDTYVYENSPAQTYLGKVPLDSSPTELISASLEGEGSENFTINNKLEIRVSDVAHIDYEYKKNYNLTVKATNTQGESNRQNVYIRVIDRDDTIKISGFATTIYEDAKGGDTIGFVKVITTGGFTINHYTISGDGSENFIVDNSGIVRVSSSAVFDRINHPSYHLELIAEDTNGVKSDRVYLDIRVTKSINTPVAKSQNITLDEDSSKAIELKATDKDGDPLTYIITTPPTNGVYKGGIYTPNANYYGSDKIIYKANDGKFDSDLATISITINNVNDAPIANDQNITLDEDHTKQLRLIGSDIDGDRLTYNIITPPTHGVYKDGKYIPNANYFGSDKIIYKANDGKIDSNLATIDITIKPVNDAPIAKAQSITIDEDNSKEIKLSGFDIEGDKLIYKIVSSPLYGVYKDWVYTPNANYNGTDSFRYVANDGKDDSKSEIVTITINPINDKPKAIAQNITLDEDTNKSILLKGSDVDGDSLTYKVVILPTHGSYENGIYTPNANYFGSDKIVYKANDGKVDSNIATIDITVASVNDDPIAIPQAITLKQLTSKVIKLQGTDIDGDKLRYKILTPPSYGNYIDGTYTPSGDYFGEDSFIFVANDGQIDSKPVTVSINITKQDVDSISDTHLIVPKYYRIYSSIGKIDINSSNVDKIWLDKYTLNGKVMNNSPFYIPRDKCKIYLQNTLEKGSYELDLFVRFKSGITKRGKVFIDNPYQLVKRDLNIIIDSSQEIGTYIGSVLTNPVILGDYGISSYKEFLIDQLFLNDIFKIYRDSYNDRINVYIEQPIDDYVGNSYNFNYRYYNDNGDGVFINVNLDIKDKLDMVEGFSTIVKNHSTFETEVNDKQYKYNNVIGRVRVQFSEEDIEDIFLVGEGSEDFTIYKDGYVIVAGGVTLDHDRQSEYDFEVMVWDSNSSYTAPIHIEVLE